MNLSPLTLPREAPGQVDTPAPAPYDVPRPVGWNAGEPRCWDELAAATWGAAAEAMHRGDDAEADRLVALARQRVAHAEAVRVAATLPTELRASSIARNPGVPLSDRRRGAPGPLRHKDCGGSIRVALVAGERLFVTRHGCDVKGCEHCDPGLAASHVAPMLDWADRHPDAPMWRVDVPTSARSALVRQVRESGGRVRCFPAHGDTFRCFLNVRPSGGELVDDLEREATEAYRVAVTCAAFGDTRRIGGSRAWAREHAGKVTDDDVEVLGVVTVSEAAAWRAVRAATGVDPVPVLRREVVGHALIRRPTGRVERVPIPGERLQRTGGWWVPLDPVYRDRLVRALRVVPHDELYAPVAARRLMDAARRMVDAVRAA